MTTAPPESLSRLIHGACELALKCFPPSCVDVVIADPPYFLSGRTTTCRGGKRAASNNGKWDQSRNILDIDRFNRAWIHECCRVLRPNGSVWISGTHHNIFNVGWILQTNGMKILNHVIWQKTNPPPNLGCRTLTHSHESLIWATTPESKYTFNYKTLRVENDNRQMKDIWRIGRSRKSEKLHGRHPTQKPIDLMRRVVTACTRPGFTVLDPFCGSGTTGVAATEQDCHFIGIDTSIDYLTIARQRITPHLPILKDVSSC